MHRHAWLALAMVLVATVPAAARKLTGVVEGYYGRPWSGQARRDVIRFLGAHGMNTFVYAPKNDSYHREDWRTPYPGAALADLRATAAVARRARVRFVYGLSPVLDVCYGCPADFRLLTRKLRQLAHARIRHFALLFDDGGQLTDPADLARYGAADDPAALASAQADLSNRVARWLARRRLGRLVLVVPTDYTGTACRPYHGALAARLRRGIPVGWTGSGVFAPTITAADARARAACLPGHPLVLWDNYPVNDAILSINLHLGPLTGRTADLLDALGGYLANPMTQPYASLVPLTTTAAYLAAPERYDPEAAWREAIAGAGGTSTGLGVLAAQVRSSALDLHDAVALAATVDGLDATYAGAQWRAAVDALDTEETRQAAAPAAIATELGDTPLADEIAPWVAELTAHAARGREGVTLLRALKPALRDLSTSAVGGGRRLTGRAVGPDTTVAAALGPGFAAEAIAIAARIAEPPFTAFVACLGTITGADIHFCPQFGLNVHGKALYLVIRELPEIVPVVDRNVHDRLVRFVGTAFATWLDRRGAGADAVTVTANGTPIALGGDGAFDATLSDASFPVTLTVGTAVGEATTYTVP